MALKNICIIPNSWTLADYDQHTCSDSSHSHRSHAEIHDDQKRGLVVWLKEAKTRRESSVVWILPSPEAKINPYAKDAGAMIPGSGSVVNTGLSFRVGEYHARAVYENQAWAITMLMAMRNPKRGVAR